MKEIGVRRVLAVMWQGVQPWAWMFWLAGAVEIVAVVLMTQIPIQFKYFFDVLASPPEEVRPVLIGILLTIVVLQVSRRLLNRFGVYLISYVQARAMPRLMEIAFEYTIGHSSHFFENSFSGALVQKVRRLANAYRAINESYYFDLLPVIVQNRGVLCVNSNTTLLLKLVRVHRHALLRSTSLTQNSVCHRRLPVVHVCNDGDIPDFHI